MFCNAKIAVTVGLLGGLSLLLPASLRADTIYTYTGGATSTGKGTFQVTVTLDTTLTGAALHSLAPGTNISADLGPSFSISPGTYPNQDNAGFPAADQAVQPPPVVEIGTDALGNITSWNISENYFVSFPAFPGENSTDFYGLYNVSTTSSGDSISLVTDNDAGLAPGNQTAGAGTSWSPTFAGPAIPAVPEPSSLILWGLGAAGLLAVARCRRKA